MNDVRDVANLAEEACSLYQHHGSADTAALLLEKAANIIQESSSVDALRLYQHAADVALVITMLSDFNSIKRLIGLVSTY